MQNQRGQIALIILLIMAVVLTIGLAVASRTVMDVSLSRQEENGSQTFQAAESGVENALNQNLAGVPDGTKIVNNVTIGASQVTATLTTSNTIQTRVDQGDSIQVQLGGIVGVNRTLSVYWAKGDTCPNRASLLIRVYKRTGAGAYSARNYAVAACAGVNQYPVAGGAAGFGYPLHYDVPLNANDQVVSIHPLGADTQLSIVPGPGGVGAWSLPAQYYTINSTATNNNGTESKAITVTKTIAGHPGILDYTLYSGSTLSQ